MSYRTLWIARGDGGTNVLQGDDFILANFGEFWKLEDRCKGTLVFEVEEEEPEDFNCIVAYQGETYYKPKEALENIDPFMARQGAEAQIWYVGRKYAGIYQQEFFETGGSYGSWGYESRLYDKGYMGGREKNLVDFLEDDFLSLVSFFAGIETQKKAEEESVVEDENIILKKQVSRDNLRLKREQGKWVVQAPWEEEYGHLLTGRGGRAVLEWLDLPVGVSSMFGIGLVQSWETIVSFVPEAKDAVYSKNGKMLVVLTSEELLVFFDPGDELGEADLVIPVEEDENIIMAETATQGDVELWEEDVKDYLSPLSEG